MAEDQKLEEFARKLQDLVNNELPSDSEQAGSIQIDIGGDNHGTIHIGDKIVINQHAPASKAYDGLDPSTLKKKKRANRGEYWDAWEWPMYHWSFLGYVSCFAYLPLSPYILGDLAYSPVALTLLGLFFIVCIVKASKVCNLAYSIRKECLRKNREIDIAMWRQRRHGNQESA